MKVKIGIRSELLKNSVEIDYRETPMDRDRISL